MSANSIENNLRPSRSILSAAVGSGACRSRSEVPCGSFRYVVLAFGRPHGQLPVVQSNCHRADRERLLGRKAPIFSEARMEMRAATKRQKDAYQAVLSPLVWSGRLGMYPAFDYDFTGGNHS